MKIYLPFCPGRRRNENTQVAAARVCGIDSKYHATTVVSSLYPVTVMVSVTTPIPRYSETFGVSVVLIMVGP